MLSPAREGQSSSAWANLRSVSADVCFQCNRCTAGCPLVSNMDLTPAQMVHYLLLGNWDPVLKSEAIWVCVHCETCTARCPQQVDISKLLNVARVLAWREGQLAQDQAVAAYFASFMENLYLYGRSAEVPLTVICKMKSGDYLRDLGLAMRMLARGRLNLLSLPRSGALYRRLVERVRGKEAAG